MQVAARKRFGMAAVAVGVAIGCTSVVDHIVDEASTGGDAGADGFASLENEFSDAPVSPGGTGGVVVENPELAGEKTQSFFTAFQIDPVAEDTAGPKFVVAADINRDGRLDLISGWNQSQPVQLHLQNRDAEGNVSFRTVTLGGTSPMAWIAGVEVGLINDDDWLDLVILSKTTGGVTLCPPQEETGEPTVISALEGEIIILFNPGDADLLADGDNWSEIILVNQYMWDNPLVLASYRGMHRQFPGAEFVGLEEGQTKPEWNGFTALAVGDMDGVSGDDIVVALNPGECSTLGQKPPTTAVDLWINPGGALAETVDLWGTPEPEDPTKRVPVTILLDAPQVKDIALTDVDADTDLDIVATFTNAISWNVRWARNPLVPHQPGGPSGQAAMEAGVSDGFRLIATGWERRPIGALDTGADMIHIVDVDQDGFDDVLVRSTFGQIIQWFRRPNPLVLQPEFPPADPVPDRFDFPWQVFTLTEFGSQEPEAIGAGDVTGDGLPEILAAAEGAVYWYDGTVGDSVYDPWFGRMVVQDGQADTTDPGATAGGADPAADPIVAGTGVGVTEVDTSTHINALLIVDLDEDGKMDIVGTLDRRTGPGLSDDRLVWYRNTRTDEEP